MTSKRTCKKQDAEVNQTKEYALSKALPRTLLHAFYWVDDGLQAHMRKMKGFWLPRTQSIMMILIGDGVNQQSEMAKILGISKQAVSQATKELIQKKLVELKPDPHNGRQKIVTFTPQGRKMRDIAKTGLQALETELGKRIGKQKLNALHDALDAPWGDPPT